MPYPTSWFPNSETGMERLDHDIGPYAQEGWTRNHIDSLDQRIEKAPDEESKKALRDQRKALLDGNAPRDITASDRIKGHAMMGGLAPEAEKGRLRAELGLDPGDKRDPYEVSLGMGSKDDRLKILGMMNQNGSGDMETGERRCGAAVLLGGAMLGGGKDGIGTLVGAVEAMAKKSGPLSEDMKKQMKEMDELVKKMGDKKNAASMGDLNKLQNDIFMTMNPGAKNDGTSGTDRKKVEELFKSSPQLAKMFKDNDLSYESVDTANAGSGGHAVLGIGHARGDKGKTGPNEMIYDPYTRRNLDPDAMAEVKSKGQQAEDLKKDLAAARMARDTDKIKDLEGAVARAEAHRDAAQGHEQAIENGTAPGWKPASQLITNRLDVADYYQAEKAHVGTDGVFHNDNHAGYQPYVGMY